MREALDIHRVLGALNHARTSLELDTPHLCYLVALWARVHQDSLASLDDDTLVDIYLQVCELYDPTASNPQQRANHAIQRLSDQRMIRRVDGAGVTRAGEFTLTRLAMAVVEFFVDDETLTKESLVVLTRALISQLGAIRAAAISSTTPEGWHLEVAEPLRIAVADLVTGIERRQRGLDRQQEDVRDQISTLLQRDWFADVVECDRLLEETSTTLNELNEVLMHDVSHLQTLLQEIEQLAKTAGAEDAAHQAENVQIQLDRVLAWGVDRQKAWSTFYQHVQRYLRDVVRLDPDRAISQRLRAQLATWLDAPFAFIAADEERIRLLRDDLGRVERPPVTRAHQDDDASLQFVPIDTTSRTLEERVADALAAGADRLSAVVVATLPAIPPVDHYRTVGRIAEAVATHVRIARAIEREWVDMPDAELALEEWTFDGSVR